jgi:endoglucanase
MSLFWSQWGGKWWTAETVRWLVEDWKITLVRAPLAVERKNTGADSGYLHDQAGEKAKMIRVVDAAIAEGIYVLIDWHDHQAEMHINLAKGFFNEMASKYGRVENVIWETYNEPLQVDWGSVIKPYHEQIVPVIRAHSQNLIILGTKTWSQRVDEAAANPVRGTNLAYTIHYYTGQPSHNGDLRAIVQTALQRGIAVFATEYGVSKCTQNSENFGEAQAWYDLMDQNHISHANWGIFDKPGNSEDCAALMEGAGVSGWAASDLTKGGNWVRNKLRNYGSGSGAPSPGSSGGGCCKWGSACGDCGKDSSGWCHASASNCAVCTGNFDFSAAAPSCR